MDDLYRHTQLIGQVLQQVGIGADQLLRILRVAPQVWRILRITRRHQALALACGNRKRRHQQCREQQQRRPIKTTLKHWRFLDLTLDGRLRPHSQEASGSC